MSTMVQMPVRVKPPPAEIGEIISPGCAALAMTTPLNGARISKSFTKPRCTARLRAVTSTSRSARARRARNASSASSLRSRSAALANCRSAKSSMRCKSSSAWRMLTRISFSAASAAPSCDSARVSWARGMESSNTARICPSRTVMPSSTSTSSTLPVVLELTVACRRATT